METAIKKAIEGGYDYFGYVPEAINISEPDGMAALAFLDPLFWQALGKSLGWEKEKIQYHVDSEHWNEERRCIVEGFVEIKLEGWLWYWVNFVEYLASGKDADSFFANLIKTPQPCHKHYFSEAFEKCPKCGWKGVALST